MKFSNKGLKSSSSFPPLHLKSLQVIIFIHEIRQIILTFSRTLIGKYCLLLKPDCTCLSSGHQHLPAAMHTSKYPPIHAHPPTLSPFFPLLADETLSPSVGDGESESECFSSVVTVGGTTVHCINCRTRAVNIWMCCPVGNLYKQ